MTLSQLIQVTHCNHAVWLDEQSCIVRLKDQSFYCETPKNDPLLTE